MKAARSKGVEENIKRNSQNVPKDIWKRITPSGFVNIIRRKKKEILETVDKKNVDKVLITFIESGRKVDDHDDDDGDGSSDRNEGTTAQTPVAISLSA